MIEITLILPEHVIFRQRSLFINSNISYLAEMFSVEEGWGTSIDKMGYGLSFTTSKEVGKVSSHDRVNSKVQRFNKQ